MGIYFSKTSVIYFCWGVSCCPYHRGVRNSEVSARRELTVFCSGTVCKIGAHDVTMKMLATLSPLQDAQIQPVEFHVTLRGTQFFLCKIIFL